MHSVVEGLFYIRFKDGQGVPFFIAELTTYLISSLKIVQ